MKTHKHLNGGLAFVAASVVLAGCGGGGGGNSSTPTTPPTGNPPPATTATTAGVWKGTISSTATNQTSGLLALTSSSGHSVWMSTDGRIWSGQVPRNGDRFDSNFAGHMSEGAHFPDGTNHGSASMTVDHHSTAATNGRYSGSGDHGAFDMALSAMWNRPASLSSAAGVYTRTTSNGYTMTLTLGANGQLTGSDSRGCVFTGTFTVPDAAHNMFGIDADVSSCGTLDGHYQGMGTLLDADAMQDWMTDMHPLEHGGHSHGGSMGSGHGMGHNTVPSGQHNLFVFSMANDRAAIMDALAR